MSDTAAQLRRTPPPPPLRWLANTMRVHVLGADQIPADGAVLVAHRPGVGIVHAALAQELGEKCPIVHLDAAVTAPVAREDVQEGAGLLLPIDQETRDARQQIVDAIQFARATNRAVFPVGIAAGSTLTLGGSAIPLPWSRAVIIVDAPFQVPTQPAKIPLTWAESVLRLLEQANGRAVDILATWKHSGQDPAPD